MDSAEEIHPLVVEADETTCEDGRTQERRPPPLGAAAAVSKVLEDSNLLNMIFLRLGFPTTLVRAALVCKRWYHHGSDRGFLKDFRKLHLPRLLGFYNDEHPAPRFFPMLHQPLELTAIVRRLAGYRFIPYDAFSISIRDCLNGHILTRRRQGREFTYELHRPLSPEGGLPILPPLPSPLIPIHKILGAILSKEEGDSLSYLFLLAKSTREGSSFRMDVYALQDGNWCLRNKATSQIFRPLTASKVVVAGSKIYMPASCGDSIIVLNLMTSSLSKILLPHEVKYHCFCTALSRADDASDVYLTHVNELQLRTWFHKGDNWLLVHKICLRELCANLRMLDHTLEDEHIGFPHLCHVGDNAEFAFLKMCGCILYLDVTSKTLHKVHDTAGNHHGFSDIYPFMMTWPPIFPALKDAAVRNAM